MAYVKASFLLLAALAALPRMPACAKFFYLPQTTTYTPQFPSHGRRPHDEAGGEEVPHQGMTSLGGNMWATPRSLRE